MFYYLFIKCHDHIDVLQEKLKTIIPIRQETISFWNDTLIFPTDNYTLNVQKKGLTIKCKNEDYNQNFNNHFNFEVFPNTNWATELMRITGELIRLYDSNCLVEANGDIPILLRKNNKIIVDDSKLHGKARFPFDALHLEYHYGQLNNPNT